MWFSYAARAWGSSNKLGVAVTTIVLLVSNFWSRFDSPRAVLEQSTWATGVFMVVVMNYAGGYYSGGF